GRRALRGRRLERELLHERFQRAGRARRAVGRGIEDALLLAVVRVEQGGELGERRGVRRRLGLLVEAGGDRAEQVAHLLVLVAHHLRRTGRHAGQRLEGREQHLLLGDHVPLEAVAERREALGAARELPRRERAL